MFTKVVSIHRMCDIEVETLLQLKEQTCIILALNVYLNKTLDKLSLDAVYILGW